MLGRREDFDLPLCPRVDAMVNGLTNLRLSPLGVSAVDERLVDPALLGTRVRQRLLDLNPVCVVGTLRWNTKVIARLGAVAKVVYDQSAKIVRPHVHAT